MSKRKLSNANEEYKSMEYKHKPLRRGRKFSKKIKGPVPFTGKELKFVDVAASTVVSDTTGSITLLNGIGTGDDFNTRDGRQIIMKSVKVRGFHDLNADTVAHLSRLLIVWDNAPNGALPAIIDILAASTALAETNVNNQQRFTILGDWQSAFSGTIAAQSSMAGFDTSFLRYVKLNHITQYLNTGNTITSIQNGALYLVTIGNQAAGANAAQVFFNTRVRYVEG